ncbi:MAG: hypothetical protein KDH98_23560 [Calditrichaeota bacterium]|nr:hypothetical protein [Calditrichota bacterium]
MADYKILKNATSFDDLDRFTADIIQNMWNALEAGELETDHNFINIVEVFCALPIANLKPGQYELISVILSLAAQIHSREALNDLLVESAPNPGKVADRMLKELNKLN